PPRDRIEVRLERVGANARLYVSDSGGPPAQAALATSVNVRATSGKERFPSRRDTYASFDVARARRTVEQHGGTLSLAPADGAGITYVMEMPLRAVGADHRVASAGMDHAGTQPDSPLPSIDGRRIMVVDDQEAARD